jgi:hypothetical protein
MRRRPALGGLSSRSYPATSAVAAHPFGKAADRSRCPAPCARASLICRGHFHEPEGLAWGLCNERVHDIEVGVESLPESSECAAGVGTGSGYVVAGGMWRYGPGAGILRRANDSHFASTGWLADKCRDGHTRHSCYVSFGAGYPARGSAQERRHVANRDPD